ncbi:Crp/Fnr family transcriptional regulator [Treponema sp. Marseille-Q4130]|uniref:Crp/Fnr family transcriptional regulator n=1 Tax=Treponema sp. Marseille-Q4130 TaxID=2766702 RepID=UPI001651BB90|nr:Crp/Fnr family transcriptional regulator [Treponema sp. Marseille-Q4130]MBC6720893.1 Crp/Fnr family transcriptional regulator [Treponema sp. Marseille-Q4130]
MPKAMQYTKGSIVYFEGDKDERIFILQKGILVLTTTDVETHQPVTEQVKNGEFFGVKSALGRFPREETATALTDCVTIALTIQEFEQIFSSNKQIIMKMLRVFSNQLRLIHKKTEAILNNVPEDQQTGMIAVAKSFYNDEEYLSCCDICVKFLSLYPNTAKKDEVAKLYADAKLRNTKIKEKTKSTDAPEEDEEASGALKQFALPAFKRFAKQYKPGNVIISEFEPGNSFYLIQSGRVQLVKCVNGAKKNLDIMKPGEFFGEMAILDNSPRSATCVAIGNVECLEFNKENFELLIMGNPQIAIILLKLFCKRIYDQRRRLRTLAIKDVQARIADVFLMFDEMNPSANANDRQRKFNVSAGDVAHWAGLSPEATRDEINKFVEKRKIEVYDSYIIVDNIADMKRIVDTRSGLSEQK